MLKRDIIATQDMINIVDAIISERIKQNMSRSKLSEKSGVKVSTICKLEKLKIIPKLADLIKILNTLNLHLTITTENI